ncbi:MAG: pyruvate carboxylase subunit A [Deltaproteobacteria bacterium HGW-Deltaproteobacteria-6]|jgi:acetyl-CoA carboxylase biotin carboxylase subunit|nr:MAG: pyruvate carboxylase subunit A [Deltaproteobacteria bacterium HGW-Deltaproteobacteria-6]
MFEKILIANRGEISVRIMSTCREMGIKTVAVHSEADKEALHVLEANQTVCLGPAEPSESYLQMDRIISAAKQTGAQAIHPGYGFLSENPVFAQRCAQEGIIFIGPPAGVIRNLGNKTVARQIMIKSDVPVIPGMMAAEQNHDILIKEADRIGYPVIIKAAAGGGGKGMRIVWSPEDFREAAVSAASEARSAFGNGDIYLEKYFEKSRHVEFQILADTHGNIIHLLERECSIQRRHQKIIEETPSPALTPTLREAMGKSAVAAAKAAGYINAGTVEFLLDETGKFYFLEVNTRLQVEHPITEMITGIDLVRQQIEIAAGSPLTLSQGDIVGRGHAIECRIYAEDPLNSFMPSPGKIHFVKEPRGGGIRNDCGIYSGYTVPMEYDPILSKLITHAEKRDDCIERMIKALKSYIILGVLTPIPLLVDILSSESFRRGETFTDFMAVHFNGWKPAPGNIGLAGLAYMADQISKHSIKKSLIPAEGLSPSPWLTLANFRP